MARERLIREHLTLRGADLFLRLPDGETIAADAGEAKVVLERPDPDYPTHSPDFASVTWGGKVYTFTPKQRRIVAILWQAWERGERFVGGGYLLEAADSDQSKMSYLFRGSTAWRTLIVPGELYDGPVDTYCLAPLAKT